MPGICIGKSARFYPSLFQLNPGVMRANKNLHDIVAGAEEEVQTFAGGGRGESMKARLRGLLVGTSVATSL
jgi:hypothetical protein